MHLYHFYDRCTGPFKSLTKLSPEKAKEVLEAVKAERPDSFCAQRNEEYIDKRRSCEQILRKEFAAIGGVMEIKSPHYMVLGYSPWLYSWYEQPEFIKIPVEEFDLKTVSFTYGDSMPTFSDRVNDGREYRKKLYTFDEIFGVIEKYGYPQEWNADGKFGPERYIEAHIWTDRGILR